MIQVTKYITAWYFAFRKVGQGNTKYFLLPALQLCAIIYVFCSVLLGCSCCSPVDDAIENVARTLATRMKTEKSHWAAGRVGDIDFIGSTKTKGKVRSSNRNVNNENCRKEKKSINVTKLMSETGCWQNISLPFIQFVRVRSNTDPVLIYKMMTEEWGLAPPHLVVALVGGDELAQMKPWLRDTLRKGLVKAAQSTGFYHRNKTDLDLWQ